MVSLKPQMPKILFIAAHRPDRSPSQRYRFEQYFDFLKSNGFECRLSYLLSSSDDKYFYRSGHLLSKMIILVKSFFKRLKDIFKAKEYDIIFVQREAFMIGSTFFEKLFKITKAKLVFDFDDAIWLLDVSAGNKMLRWLKNPKKTSRLIKLSDFVIAGNSYLADYAKRFNNNVKIIPTTVDTEKYIRVGTAIPDKICIGWSGSITTIKHFEDAVPVLKKLKAKYGDKIYFKVVGDPDYRNTALNIQGIPWTSETEVKELSSFDIGIMPLPDDEWAKGKCGLKGLTYMALETPTIMSPVGVNTEIIQDGITGFLASTPDEWFQKLSTLIESEELRKRIGKSARQTVVERYSVLSQRNNYLNCFKEVLKS